MSSPPEDHFHSPPDEEEENTGQEVPIQSFAPPVRAAEPEKTRNWGESGAHKQPEFGAAARSLTPPSRKVSGQSLAPPSRKISGSFVGRVQQSLVVIPEASGAAAPPTNLGRGISIGATTPGAVPPGGGPASAPGGPASAAPPTRNPSTAPSSAAKQSSILRTGGAKRGASTIQGKKTVRLSILPVSGGARQQQEYRDQAAHGGYVPSTEAPAARYQSFAPKRLLDIENGKSIVVSEQKFLDPTRYQDIDKEGALVVTAKATAPIAKEDAQFFQDRGHSLQDKIQSGDIRDFEANDEVGLLGGAWRGILRRLMVASYDEISALRLSRQLQLFLPFQTGYEAYIIGQIIEALDGGRIADVRYILSVAFKNRNVSRVIVQNVGPRWDFLWHWHQQVTSNRLYDGWGQFPIVGITAFPASENFLNTRDHALASMSRIIFGQGAWLTRVFTQGREGIITDNPKNTAQNLAAESNGFELANRNQYGNYIGRRKTNEFRFTHRLPTDESIVRTFVAQPMPTLVNNGVVHLLRQVAKHWHNMLYQFSGNFAHQRMEQLDPFETLRFHMPVILVVLSSLRGRNKWDSQVLGPTIRKLQELKPSLTADGARYLIRDLQENIVVNVSGGVASIVDPFQSWLEAMLKSCDMIEEEAKVLYQDVSAVEIGIRLGHDLITQVSWKIPTDAELKKAILNHIRGINPGPKVSERRIRSAMLLTTPRDKRTLIELVNGGHANSTPAQLLLGRVKTLLQRDLRRENLNEAIRELSMGDYVSEVVHDEWYWLEEGDKKAVYIYDNKVSGRDVHRFVHVDSGFERFVSLTAGGMKARAYIPVAEAISRAQRCFMNLELDHGKKFKYNAFMEFTYLRNALRKMVVISQVVCEELDNARLNVLREVQRSNQVQVGIHDLEVGRTYYTYDSKMKQYRPFVCKKQYTSSDPEWDRLARTKIVTVPPQSIIVIGGGPTGLMTTVHCTENVLVSGGVMKLYEARDAFSKGGATFERAQIVRLDARWIAMLRYHLGTGFEDVYIPASGETDSQLGNTLPTQGFVEITIKDLENMLHVEVSKLWSKGVIQCYTDSRAKYDLASNSLTKQGEHLKHDDLILRRVDPNGNPSASRHSWKIVDLIFTQALGLDDLRIGNEYGVYIRLKNAVLPFKLTGVDLESRTYTFKSLKDGVEDLKATAHNLPSVYPKGTTRHADVNKVVVESVVKGNSGGYVRDELPMKVIRKEKFTMDIGHTHVVECIGKPHGSKVHFSTTTYEPYGVCCIQGLKISMGMHNFGEKRWGQGILDDLRSQTDQNTRIVGDFTKMVRQAPICAKMYEFISKDASWKMHFKHVVKQSKFQELDALDPLEPKLIAHCKVLAETAPTFRRQTLQTRFFETGDNYYLGMEFTREYDRWKNKLADELVAPLTLRNMDEENKKEVARFRGVLMHHIDRLWYDGCLETIRQGDVYNPGAKKRVPRIYLINSYVDQKLGELIVGESFRVSDRPEEKYEVVIKKGSEVVVRNVEGYISKMKKNVMIKREGDLTRGPDGNQESRVALATFPVGHYVNFRTVRLNDETNGYVFTFIGDEQATPHFMRYSGLTGACINAMLFNNFVKQAVDGVPFIDRFRLYSVETNWSNGEVVQRGTGANYGVDGFLRPGFPYDHGLDYLHSKVIEYMETQQDLDNILSRDWKIKFAASMVPRGMELNEDFTRALFKETQKHIFNKFVKEVKADRSIASDALEQLFNQQRDALAPRREELDYVSYWNEFATGLGELDENVAARLQDYHIAIAIRLEQIVSQVVEYATKAYLYNERISSELFNQPKPVDSIVDDFAVEAQNFANSLTMSAAFSSGAVAFTLVDIRGNVEVSLGSIFGAIIGALNIPLSFSTMVNSSRYKIRNEEARILFFNEKFLQVKKAVFSTLDVSVRDKIPMNENPFVIELEKQVETFLSAAEYYDFDEPVEFKEAYEALKADINNPETILDFQKKLSSHFIPDVYHVSSYIQEYLVNIFKTLEGMHRLLTQEINRASGGDNAKRLHDRLVDFTPVLENSLQAGPTYWGFLKSRKFVHWDIMVVLRYFYSLLCCSSRNGSVPMSPIQTETLGIVKHTRSVSTAHQNQVLRREIRDLEHLYWATRESDVASLIFVSGFLVFTSSIIFTISRIITRAGGGAETVTSVGFWASLASASGALLGAIHLARKLFLLIGLWATLGSKARVAQSSDDREHIRKVKGVTFTQILLTILRFCAAGAAAVGLPWSVAENQFGDSIALSNEIPFWISFGAVAAAILSTIFFFVVEYSVRYNLSPKLGEYVCEAFRDEIETMYKVLAAPVNDIDTKQVQERETWEYVAREFLHKYRFDTVFAADRFGSILQYIQSGLDPRQ